MANDKKRGGSDRMGQGYRMVQSGGRSGDMGASGGTEKNRQGSTDRSSSGRTQDRGGGNR